MIFQKVYCDLLSSKHCHPHLCTCWCRFLQPGRSHLCWKSLLTSLQYILTVLTSVLLTHVCLFVSLSAPAAVSVVAPDLPSLTHCPRPRLSAQAQQGSALIPNTLLIPAFPLYPCVLPAWKALFILFQVLQASGKSQLLQEVLFDCSRPRCLLPIRAGLLRPPSIRTDLFSFMYALCPHQACQLLDKEGGGCCLQPLGISSVDSDARGST